MEPRYPIFIPSYSRWDTPYTIKTLEYMNVPYHVVVQPDQYLNYAKVVNSRKILVLPKPWWKPGEGLIHVRNWIWDRAKEMKVKRFWMLDDNITYFFRLNHNLKVPVNCGNIFRAAEDFTDRYSNVAQSGFQYFMFAKRKAAWPPFVINTRIYSCTLNLTDIPFRYELMYNDDTDLSIRVLKAGWCTILFNAFLCGKHTTMSVKGGNTDILYDPKINGRLKMAQALADKFPDIVTVTERWGRPQHLVDYSQFKANQLKFRKGFDLSKMPPIDNYGMELIQFNDGKTSISKAK
jgi:hypothetical protein